MGFGKDIERLRKLADFLRADIQLYKPGVWEELLEYDCIVAYMPSGIVVRGIAPHLKSKWVDPAVVVVDKPMRYAIPILGGHHGGNEVAKMLESIGMTAVVTTAAEYEDGLCVGIGCRKGVGIGEILTAVRKALREIEAGVEDIRLFATAELKKSEAGLIAAVDALKKPLMFLSRDEINSVLEAEPSKAGKIGLRSVAEACALYFSKEKVLLLPKRVYGNVTIAIAR